MCRARLALVPLLVAAMNASAQDSAPVPRISTPKEKAQALAVLEEARGALFPLRRKVEARQLLARIAPLLAAAGDTAGTQEVLALLPANQRGAIEVDIVSLRTESGELAAALEAATVISEEDARATALLTVAQAQAKAGKIEAAMQTAALIGSGRVEFVKALVEVAAEQQKAGKRTEAKQLLQQAAAAGAGMMNSNDGGPECGLSVLAQIANAQEGLGESTDAMKTLRLAEGRVPEADPGCKFGATRFLESEGQSGALQEERTQFRESLLPSAEIVASEDQDEEDSAREEGAADTPAQNPYLRLLQLSQTEHSPLTPEARRAALDSLRGVKPLYQRAQLAIGISQLMIAQGKTGEAEEAIVIGLEGANTVQDENLRDTLLASKAQARATAKDWDGARAVVEEINNTQQRTAALVDIAFCAAENERAQLAASWATSEASPLAEASVLVSVAEALLHQPHQTRQMFWIR